MPAKDDVRVGRAALRAGSRAHVRHRLERLVALARVVDEDECAVEGGGVLVDEVIDARHRPVVVLVRPLGHRPVEGVDDDQPEAVGLERLDAVGQILYVAEPPALVLDVDVVSHLLDVDPPRRNHLRDAVRRGLGVQLVVDDEDFPFFAREAEPRRPGRHRERKVGDEPRLSRLRRRDDVHRLAPAQEAVYQHGLHLRIPFHKLAERQDGRYVRIRPPLSAYGGGQPAEINGLFWQGLPVALAQQLPRRPRVVPAAFQRGVHLETAVAALALEGSGIRRKHIKHIAVKRRRVSA